MKIPYHRALALKEFDKITIYSRINSCLDQTQLTNGIYVRYLESKIREMYNVKYVIATSSCTQALNICLRYWLKTMQRDQVGRYRVQLPSFIWESLEYITSGFHKFHTDINKNTWLQEEPFPCISLYLHTFGNIGVSKHGNTIYDGSHCLGAKFEEIGLATCISLAPTKMITSMEGGLILTNDTPLYEFAKEYRDKCCRMSEIHAIFGLQFLNYLNKILDWKKWCYISYERHIPGQFQSIPNNSSHNTIGFLNTEKLKIPDDIETRQYYVPLRKGLKNTDFVYENMVCLPSYYNAPIGEIIDKIKELNGL